MLLLILAHIALPSLFPNAWRLFARIVFHAVGSASQAMPSVYRPNRGLKPSLVSLFPGYISMAERAAALRRMGIQP